MWGETEHDAGRWGAAYSDEAEPREVVRLADVVRHLIDAKTPVRVSAREVIKTLRASPVAEWFLLQQGCRAESLHSGDRWYSMSGESTDPLTTTLSWRVLPETSLSARLLARYEEMPPEMVGYQGMLACLGMSWTSDFTKTSEDLDRHELAACLAILKTDALRLFGAPRATAGQQGAGATVHELSSWDGGRLSVRLAELKATGIRAPMQALAAESGIKDRTIQRRIKEYKASLLTLTKLAPTVGTRSVEAWSAPKLKASAKGRATA